MLVGELHRVRAESLIHQGRTLSIFWGKTFVLESRESQILFSRGIGRESTRLITSDELLSVRGNGSMYAWRLTFSDVASRDVCLHGSTTSVISSLPCSSDSVCADWTLSKTTAVSDANRSFDVRVSGTAATKKETRFWSAMRSFLAARGVPRSWTTDIFSLLVGQADTASVWRPRFCLSDAASLDQGCREITTVGVLG